MTGRTMLYYDVMGKYLKIYKTDISTTNGLVLCALVIISLVIHYLCRLDTRAVTIIAFVFNP